MKKIAQEFLEAAIAVDFISAGHAIAKGSTLWAVGLVFVGWICLRTLKTLTESTKPQTTPKIKTENTEL